MLGCKAAVASYTHAKKAQKLLEGNGYSCRIERLEQPGTDGCGYALLVQGDCTGVFALLKAGGISYQHPEQQRGMPGW